MAMAGGFGIWLGEMVGGLGVMRSIPHIPLFLLSFSMLWNHMLLRDRLGIICFLLLAGASLSIDHLLAGARLGCSYCYDAWIDQNHYSSHLSSLAGLPIPPLFLLTSP